jgi:hypothetical protein
VGIIAGIIVAFAMFVTLWATLFTDVKVWGLFRDQQRAFREMPRERRRRIYVRITFGYLVVGAYYALLIAAPLGKRNTIIYFLIVPFLTLVPLGTIAAGIFGYRGRRPRRPTDDQKRRAPPSSQEPS